jgi:hypothetical protein
MVQRPGKRKRAQDDPAKTRMGMDKIPAASDDRSVELHRRGAQDDDVARLQPATAKRQAHGFCRRDEHIDIVPSQRVSCREMRNPADRSQRGDDHPHAVEAARRIASVKAEPHPDQPQRCLGQG